MNEISNQLTARQSEKLYCNWVIMLVTMVTPISSHVKAKVSLPRAVKICFFLVKGEIFIFHQYLYKVIYPMDDAIHPLNNWGQISNKEQRTVHKVPTHGEDLIKNDSKGPPTTQKIG